MIFDRILGYAPIAGLDRLLARLNAEPGPAVVAWHGSRLAALLQDEPAPGRGGTDTTRLGRRLATACLAGPFLPQDPAAATLPAEAVPVLLATAWEALDAALHTHGRLHQWEIAPHHGDIAPASTGERRRRTAALMNALAPAVLAFAADAENPAAPLTTLVAAGAEHRIEAALAGLETAGEPIVLRGPQPPLAFAPVRIAATAAAEIAGAWHALELEARTDRDGLFQQWRRLAAAIHPTRQAAVLSGAAPGIGGLTDAYRLLRGLLPADGAGAALGDLLHHAGRRLIVPDPPVTASHPTHAPIRLTPPALTTCA